jgi:hypothetical protein
MNGNKKDYTFEFRAEAVELVLMQSLSLAEAAVSIEGDTGELGGKCQTINGFGSGSTVALTGVGEGCRTIY